jgi:poly-gamma-glutamate synthesis protein (capsule biosynthesis protein)
MRRSLVFAGIILGVVLSVAAGSVLHLVLENSNWEVFPTAPVAGFQESGPAPENIVEKETKILFVGDIMLSRAVWDKMLLEEDPLFPFLRISDFTQQADIVFGNLEGPISLRGENQGSIYSFRADPSVVLGLVHAGFDVLSLANNHIFDWGGDALSDTVSILKENNIKTVGAGRNESEANAPALFEVNGTRVAFLGYTTLYPETLCARGDDPGVSCFNEAAVLEKIREIKKSSDIAVVSMHWGIEYETLSNDEQKRLARNFVDAGADLVIGHHPHVPQEVEGYKNSWIAYSLGNFVFDQSFSEETMRGMVLTAIVRDGRVESIATTTVFLNGDFQPSLEPEK